MTDFINKNEDLVNNTTPILNVKNEKNIVKYVFFNNTPENYQEKITKVNGLTAMARGYGWFSKYLIKYMTDNVEVLCKDLDIFGIESELEYSNLVIVISSSDHGGDLTKMKILGFAVVYLLNVEHMKVEYVCSHNNTKYVGDMLLNTIFDIGKALDIKRIKLDSVESAVNFYKKYGFTIETIPMTKNISNENPYGKPYGKPSTKPSTKKGGTKKKTRRYRRKSVRPRR